MGWNGLDYFVTQFFGFASCEAVTWTLRTSVPTYLSFVQVGSLGNASTS